MVILRDYQNQAVNEIYSRLTFGSKMEVLSISPGGGKTVTSLALAAKLLSHNSMDFKTVLVLSHGTNALKDQWIKAKDDFELQHEEIPNLDKSKVELAIPQALIRKDLPQYDLLIVDEAHEFFFAPMVQDIIKKVKPKFILAVTGTPSPFLAKGINPIIISACELFGDGYLADVGINVVRSKYNLVDEDFNATTKNVKETVSSTELETDETIEELLNEMIANLKSPLAGSPSSYNAMPNLINKALGLLSSIDKTMIACRSIEQAAQITRALAKRGISSLTSNSESDPDSKSIAEFKKDDKIKFLIVVRRGILGFDMPELANVVDMTGTRNIDRIYQLYARVLRKSDFGKSKRFYKVVSNINPAVDSLYLQASLALCDEDFIGTYNGTNLRAMSVIKLVSKKPEEAGGSKEVTIFGEQKPREKGGATEKLYKFNKEDYNNIVGLSLLNEVKTNSDSEYWKIVEYANFGEIVDKLNRGAKMLTSISHEEKLMALLSKKTFKFEFKSLDEAQAKIEKGVAEMGLRAVKAAKDAQSFLRLLKDFLLKPGHEVEKNEKMMTLLREKAPLGLLNTSQWGLAFSKNPNVIDLGHEQRQFLSEHFKKPSLLKIVNSEEASSKDGVKSNTHLKLEVMATQVHFMACVLSKLSNESEDGEILEGFLPAKTTGKEFVESVSEALENIGIKINETDLMITLIPGSPSFNKVDFSGIKWSEHDAKYNLISYIKHYGEALVDMMVTEFSKHSDFEAVVAEYLRLKNDGVKTKEELIFVSAANFYNEYLASNKKIEELVSLSEVTVVSELRDLIEKRLNLLPNGSLSALADLSKLETSNGMYLHGYKKAA